MSRGLSIAQQRALQVSGRSLTHDIVPDIGMFQSPIYQFYAGIAEESDGTTFHYPEKLTGLPDATTTGNPLIQRDVTDRNGDIWDAGEYDAVDDGHNWTGDSQLPTGNSTFSITALVWARSGTGNYSVITWGNRDIDGDSVILRFVDGSVGIDCFNVTSVSTGSNLEGEWITIGGKYDGTDIFPVANGSVGSGSSATYDLDDAAHAIGYKIARGPEWWFDGYIAEIIISDVAESDQAFRDYHTDRLG